MCKRTTELEVSAATTITISGPMDKAPAYGAGDSGRDYFLSFCIVYIFILEKRLIHDPSISRGTIEATPLYNCFTILVGVE